MCIGVSVGVAVQTKIHFRKVKALKWVLMMKSWHCYGQHLMWRSLGEAVCLPPEDGEQDDALFPSQTVISGERGAIVWFLCLLLSCPVAVRVVTRGQSFLVDTTCLFQPQSLDLLNGKICTTVSDFDSSRSGTPCTHSPDQVPGIHCLSDGKCWNT